MQHLFDHLLDLAGDSPSLMLSALIFLAVATLAFGIMGFVRVKSSVNRRVSDALTGTAAGGGSAPQNSLRQSSLKTAQKLIDYTAKYYSATDTGNVKLLQSKLIQAGFLNPRAAGIYFVSRAVLGLAFFGLAFLFIPSFYPDLEWSRRWMLIAFSALVGYFAPSFYLGQRIKANMNEHRAGFPDFMDLLVVCAEAGLSMEAALDRVGRELADSYRSLSANIHMATLEIRAGRTLPEALEHLGDRLGLEEARSFATLLQQSTELGSSVVDALRVYSDEMRHKRLSRAEEKAYSLPTKLSVPLILCIFPVLVIVTLLPAYIRVKYQVY
jgi:tight adherence protein C